MKNLFIFILSFPLSLFAQKKQGQALIDFLLQSKVFISLDNEKSKSIYAINATIYF